jgi:predicted Zn-ribbon and HTH transcriptional regulator
MDWFEKNKKHLDSYWIKHVKQRIEQNKNFQALIYGSTGSGKSWACLSMALMLDPTFTADRVIFDHLELVQLTNRGKLAKGSAIVFEEVGITLDSSEWQSVINKAMRHIFETIRHRNNILLLNTPSPSFLAKGTRTLLHAMITPVGIDFHNKITRCKAEGVQYNPKMDKVYYKNLRVSTEDGLLPVQFWLIPKPPDDLIAAYEVKKRAFTDVLYSGIEKELLGLENRRKGKEKVFNYNTKCLKCGHLWERRGSVIPKCPKCQCKRTENHVLAPTRAVFEEKDEKISLSLVHSSEYDKIEAQTSPLSPPSHNNNHV